ncbi:MAG: hypothetical protein ACWGNK_12285 [Desulfobacterales bacterium]
MLRSAKRRQTARLVCTVLFYWVILTAGPCQAAGDILLPLQRFIKDLALKNAELLDGEKQIIGLSAQLELNDLPYINSIVASLNSIETCLYYQSELAGVYHDVAGINDGYVRSQLPRMMRQVDFTLDSVEIEYKKISIQYMQVIGAAALKITDRLRKSIRETRQLLQEHLKWLESESTGTIKKYRQPERSPHKL